MNFYRILVDHLQQQAMKQTTTQTIQHVDIYRQWWRGGFKSV